MTRTLLTAIFLTLFRQTAWAEERWACEGFLATGDGSKSPPFLMTGDADRYTFKIRFNEYSLTRVARARMSGYDIYVGDVTSSHNTAYYIQSRKETLGITQFHWDMKRFTTECFRQ